MNEHDPQITRLESAIAQMPETDQVCIFDTVRRLQAILDAEPAWAVIALTLVGAQMMREGKMA